MFRSARHVAASSIFATGIVAASLTASAAPASAQGVQPFDHYGCNQTLCITVKSYHGSGNYITYMSGGMDPTFYLQQSQYVYLYWGEWNENPNTFEARYLGGLGETETQGPVNYFADVPNPQFTPRIFTIGHYICFTAIAAIYGTLPGRPCAEVL